MFHGSDWGEAPLSPFCWEENDKRHQFYVQRDDLLHPIISGNKSRKLYGWLQKYQMEGYEGIVTFGGAYSNHLIATACICHDLNIPSVGLIRGDEGVNNHYLDYAKSRGMELVYVTREDYRNKKKLTEEFHFYKNRSHLVIPEGGAGVEGLLGFEALINKWVAQDQIPDLVVHASATGTTAAGLAAALDKVGVATKVSSVMVLKNENEQRNNLISWGINDRVELINDYHFGGYAKSNEILLNFLREVGERLKLPLEPVYSGKAFYAFIHDILPRFEDKRVCFLHTGGIFP